MHWEDKRVTVMGLGLLGGGVGSVKYFIKHGAKVTVTDLRNEEALEASLSDLSGLPVRFVLGEHREEDFSNVDLVLRNPGVPIDSSYLQIAREKGVPIENDASIFLAGSFRLQGVFVVGVTGTKGKSTTAALITEALRAVNVRVDLTGTSGKSLLEALGGLEAAAEEERNRVVVAEFSSWDLESIAVSPPLAVITSFFPDHLNRHGTMRTYLKAKTAIFRFQAQDDILIIPDGNAVLLEAARRAPGKLVVVGESEQRELPELSMRGAHQRKNAALASVATREALAHPAFPVSVEVPFENAVKAIGAFPGLEGRLQVIGKVDGRVGINDTTATNPGATIAAFDAIDGPVILIAGGDDKGLDYEELVENIAQRAKHLVLFEGSASKKLLQALGKHEFGAVTSGISTMREAVEEAMRVSAPGDTILLSPAAMSFNLFSNEFDRGEQFMQAFETS